MTIVALPATGSGDLEDLYDHIAAFDDPSSAGHVPDRLLRSWWMASHTLRSAAATRGGLVARGIEAYRHLPFKPYRVIYRIVESAWSSG